MAAMVAVEAAAVVIDDSRNEERGSNMQLFKRYIGIEYSGAETADSSLKGLRIYLAEIDGEPQEVLPPTSPRKYWTRRGIAEWLQAILTQDVSTLVGIDHGFSFPLRYFEVHQLHKHSFEPEQRTPDQQDAYAITAWFQQADLDGRLATYLSPNLTPGERAVAEVEGWIVRVG
jgi:hypothetical protein